METASLQKLPSSPDALLSALEAAINKERFTEAELLGRKLLASHPLDKALLSMMGAVLERLGRFREAAVYNHKVISLDTNDVHARFNLASTCKQMGELQECENQLRAVLAIVPDFIDAWQNLAVCCAETGRYVEAIECYEQVARLDPGRTGFWAEMGQLYSRLGDNLGRALFCFDTVLERIPEEVDILAAKGNVLCELERYTEAESCYRTALCFAPGDSHVLNNLGLNYRAQGDWETALGYFERALLQEPGEPSIIFNRGVALLMLGDYTRGWDDYKARFNSIDRVYLPPLDLPEWTGEQLDGRTLLVRAEQGYGDNIQFARYLPLLSRYSGRIVLECNDEVIAPLFQNYPGIEELVIRGDRIPDADFQIPVGSLPHVFSTDITSIPFPQGYLSPAPDRIERIRDAIPQLNEHAFMKIGLVWGGRKTRLNANRSLGFRELDPLFSLPGIRWFSLQKGEDALQMTSHRGQIVDLGSHCKDFADTAAILSELDLVITIDTAMAHLAGAQGVPGWVLLKKGADWRWMMNRDDSPWYSSLRLFRQEFPGDWAPVVAKIYDHLKKMQKTSQA